MSISKMKVKVALLGYLDVHVLWGKCAHMILEGLNYALYYNLPSF